MINKKSELDESAEGHVVFHDKKSSRIGNNVNCLAEMMKGRGLGDLESS